MKPNKSLKVEYEGFINYSKAYNLKSQKDFPNKDYY